MKKLLVLTMVLVSFASYGQDRVNVIKPNFTEVSLPLTQATGWNFDDVSGKWLSYPNHIIDTDEEQNFYSIDFRKIKHKERNYYVMFIKKKSYYFDYPSIHRGYHSYVQYISHTFTEEEYNKLKNINDEVELKSVCGTDFNHMWEDEKNPIKFIKDWTIKELDEPDSYEYIHIFKVQKTTSKGKVVYRFLLPYTEKGLSSFSGDFKTSYFETSSINSLLTFTKTK